MLNIPYFVDMHVHSTLKPFRYEPDRSIFEFIPKPGDPDHSKELPWILRLLLGGMLREYGAGSQVNLDACLESKTRVIGLSLYPPERNIFDLRKLIKSLLGKNQSTFGAAFTRFQKESIESYLEVVENNLPVDYCGELEDEYQYLLQQAQSTVPGKELIIAENYTHLQNALHNNSQAIIAILTLEGLHSLAKYASYDDLITFKEFPNNRTHTDFKKYLDKFSTNIDRLKQWHNGKHTPFFVTFAHHFWNLLCGHSRSFAGIIRKMAINQECGRNHDFTALGLTVLDLLLNRENGRQILIDIKHMSARARRTFYQTRKAKYVDQGNSFPIICSHAAVSGVATLREAIKQKDLERDNARSYFNLWSINLSDEDILEIFHSDGLIGIVLHEDRLPGGIPKHRIDGYKQTENSDKLRDEYLKLLMSNIFHIVRVCNHPKAWNIICLGSDFDGAINALETYPDVKSYEQLAQNIFEYFQRPLENSEISPPLLLPDFNRLTFGISVHTLVEKLMYQNAIDFLKKYFTTEYLELGQQPPFV